MARLNWGVVAERFFETGVDHGVLYTGDGIGVPWNGLTSVNETPIGGDPKPAYIDGRKFRNIASSEEFEATIEAFAAPKEFGPCDGSRSIQNGLIATQQPRQAFNFSYRTLIGNPIEGAEFGYKIHLVYNALAGPAQRTNGSIKDSTEASRLSWAITTLPPSLSNYKATSHFVIDSRETPRGLLAAVEDILYGTEINSARMPLVSELVTMFQSEGPVMRRNLVTNPSFRAVGAQTEIRRNLTMNPAYRAPGTAAFEMRRNYITDPMLTAATGWTGVGAAGAVPAATTHVYSPNQAAAVGDTWAVGLEIVNGSGVTLTGTIGVGATTGASFGANALGSTNVSVPAGQTLRFTNYFTLAAGADGLRLLLSITNGGGAPSGIVVRKAMMAKEPGILPYFDGSTPAADGLTYSWTGSANASASIATATRVNTSALRPYLRNTWQMTGGATDGSNSARAYVASNSSTLLLFSSDAPPIANGDAVSGSFRVRLVNATAPISINPILYGYSSAGAAVATIVTMAPVIIPADGSWVDVKIPNGLVNNASIAQARLYITSTADPRSYPGSPIIETSNVLVEKAAVCLPWFDGRTLASDGLTYGWSGTADASPATASGVPPATLGASLGTKFWRGADGASLRVLKLFGVSGFLEVTGGLSTPVVEGTVLSRSLTIASDVESTCTFGYAYTGAGANGTVAVTSEPDPVRYRIVTPPAPAGATFNRLIFTPAVGVPFTLTDHMVENGDVDGWFFDGSTVDDDGYFYSWEGTANASISRVNTWN
ncbi:MAG: hypothetical protein IPM04_13185 [Saprospiraceae bacterium]|nr:hypothetical protein [Candidatus Brachybacter algidus]MBK8748771.1 hypothetical protein [Candidatus Brachybacter algidus]